MKKNKYIFVTGLLAVLTVLSVILSMCFRPSQEEEDGMLVVTSLHPVYVATINVTDGVDGVRVRQLSQPTTGCVHDHQLTTQDMRLLEKADVFIINGAGMESYLEDVMERYPELTVIDTSEGCSVLEASGEHSHAHGTTDSESEEHTEDSEEAHEHTENSEESHEHAEDSEESHVHEGDEHNHTDNSHIWMNMDNYCIQIGNIGNALAAHDKQHAEAYEANQKRYIQSVQNLKEEGRQQLAALSDREAVSMHEAFSYFAQNFDWHMEHTINMDENTSLSAAQVSEVLDTVQQDGISYVFTEAVYGTRLSSVLEKETSAKTVVLDTLVSGGDDKDSYLDGMRENIEHLREVAAK